MVFPKRIFIIFGILLLIFALNISGLKSSKDTRDDSAETDDDPPVTFLNHEKETANVNDEEGNDEISKIQSMIGIYKNLHFLRFSRPRG